MNSGIFALSPPFQYPFKNKNSFPETEIADIYKERMMDIRKILCFFALKKI